MCSPIAFHREGAAGTGHQDPTTSFWQLPSPLVRHVILIEPFPSWAAVVGLGLVPEEDGLHDRGPAAGQQC
jgi:hypothetical protein